MAAKIIRSKDAEHEFRVDECDFEFKCPLQWDALVVTADNDIRFCHECQKHVFRCRSRDEFEAHRSLGHCVAAPYRESPTKNYLGVLPMIQPRPDSIKLEWD